ncbi:GIY-YIG nuclease family protein [Fulvivirga sp. M361]|uniref:GIY-YIG nuclease family protein n=1 Tax=Fulvivirga sp. M361 TaxID=2594266 RepID=UPI00117AB093|nr:GIY-YIG nuclease family protein [Fulvivirga sp. M361]TRX61191.1 GIY-YIG nuclease family protein [Fulvivirga sp. M361]
MKKGGAVYILTNTNHTTLYIGVCEDLIARTLQHKEKHFPGSFTDRYNCNKLVYYELFHAIEEAIDREKQIKAGSRKKKIQLIESINPEWKDLYDEMEDW